MYEAICYEIYRRAHTISESCTGMGVVVWSVYSREKIDFSSSEMIALSS